MKIRHLALLSALALAVPTATLDAQWGNSGTQQYGYREGYDRGLRAGEEDSRRNQSFNFTDESDYRSADAGYRSQYGSRDRYRDEFRRGYAEGYRAGYARSGYNSGRSGVGFPPWANGRGRGRGNVPSGPYVTRNDPAFAAGFNDGYEAGLDDGRDRRQNNPIAESRYRRGDREYRREYGSRDAYKIRYREAFKQGYARGYDDGRRYGSRSWWPW